MRVPLLVLVVVLAVTGAAAALASAQSRGNGLPAYTDGYAKWQRINRAPLTAPGAHNGVKNVYASKKKVGSRWPEGTVIVKSIAEPGSRGLPGEVAVMRKVKGVWQWVEYTRRGGPRYAVLAEGALCSGCHMQVKANDWVFTKR